MVSKKLVLVFDDLERSKQDKATFLGAINDYCENRNIKTIIIADEDHISEDEYKEFKEKVISHTLLILKVHEFNLKITMCIVWQYLMMNYIVCLWKSSKVMIITKDCTLLIV